MVAEKKESEQNNGMQLYYLLSTAMFGLLSVNSFSFYSSYASHTCLAIDPAAVPRTNTTTRLLMEDSLSWLANTTEFTHRRLGLTQAQQAALDLFNQQNKEGIQLMEGTSSTGNAFYMFIFYLIQAILSLMIALGMMFFSRYLPTQIPKLNCCIRLYGGIVRLFMML